MALESMIVYRITSGDAVYPHSGNFGISLAGAITLDDSNGSGDSLFGDFTHTGGGDVPDQDVTASTVSGISSGDTVDSRYQYTFTGSDGSSGNIYFLATNGASNYGPLIVSDAPLDPSVTYTFGTFNTDGAVPYNSLVQCFLKGTRIETSAGIRDIEALVAGDYVRTMDAGFQEIKWIGATEIDAIDLTVSPNLRPIRIRAGALGNGKPVRDLYLSPQHRVLVRSRIAERMFGLRETLVPAVKLLALDGVDIADDIHEVTYFHILCDRHHILFSEGVASESLYLGENSLAAMSLEGIQEIRQIFPDFDKSEQPFELARPLPAIGHKMSSLIERHQKNTQPLQ